MRLQRRPLLGILCTIMCAALASNASHPLMSSAQGSKAETRGGVNAVMPRSLANVDSSYRALRDGKPNEAYEVNNLTLKRDVGTFRRISYLPAVMERVTIGIFVGEGEFTLVPATGSERDYFRSIVGKETVTERFDRLVLCFSDNTYTGDQNQGAGGRDGFEIS